VRLYSYTILKTLFWRIPFLQTIRSGKLPFKFVKGSFEGLHRTLKPEIFRKKIRLISGCAVSIAR